jgi:serine/threonine protein kinase
MAFFNVTFAMPGFPHMAAPMACGPMVPMMLPPAHASGDLRAGAEVKVGQHRFRLVAPLGRGSFSTVWSAAHLDGSGEVAIKETVCRTHDDVKDAERESKIMQLVAGLAQQSPDFIACETTPSGQGTTVRLAMAKVHGDSLGTFLQRYKKEWAPSPNPQVIANQFAEACNFTRELLVQLVPSFDAISSLVLHRDVNTHNVLVSAGPGASNPRFSLIDYGLAIETQDWAQQLTKVPVVGDCRYWPVSAWFIFAHGGQKLSERHNLMMEYRTQLDTHALGITALQVFIELLTHPTSPAAASSVPEEVWTLRHAWEQYWQDAYRFWEPLFKAFENKTDWNSLRQRYISNKVHSIMDKDLQQLRRALANLCDACGRAEPGSTASSAAPIFAAMKELISQSGKPLGREACPNGLRFASWANVWAILGGAQLPPSNVSAVVGTTTTTPLGPSPPTSSRRPSKGNQVHGSTTAPMPSMWPMIGSTTSSPYVATNTFAPPLVVSTQPVSFASYVPGLRMP